MTSAAVSPSGTYMAFGDVEGGIFFLTSMEEGVDAPLNGFEGQPVEWADPPDPVPDIDWTEKTYVRGHAVLEVGLTSCVQAAE